MIDILQIDEGLWVLEEDGQNVALKDCVKFEITKTKRKDLFLVVVMVAKRLQKRVSLDSLVEQGLVKKLDRQKSVALADVWEARSPGGGRIIFMIKDPDTIVISAVHKGHGSLTQAVDRGMGRWRRYLKEKGV